MPPDGAMIARCELCPRRCGANRAGGDPGWCLAGNRVEVFRYGPHHGEEPPVSGTRGSGTVFFSRCTMRCIYCQNYPWSQESGGTAYSVEDLAGMLASLHKAGCHNWNIVSPTPWLPWIDEAASGLRKAGVALPFVYNTSGFERIETLEAYGRLTDVFLTDLRYAEPASAAEGSEAPTYVKVARSALEWMWQNRGPLQVDAEGIAKSGVICRILVLPDKENEAIASLRWLAETVGTEVDVSLMAQYTPAYKAMAREPWNRRPTEAAYDRVRGELEKLGFENGWVQEYEAETPDELIGYRMPAGGDAGGTTPG